jgi:aspartyl-tRNA(Asn)/glutamyl-tRNA(Gln) amidotransferase subunit C
MIPARQKLSAASRFHKSFRAPNAVKLTRQNVEQIAHLARIEIGPGEIDGVVGKLGRIVEFVDQLQAVETSGVVPMAHPVDMSQRLRADQVSESDRRDLYQQNSQSVADGLYLVPRVLE